MRKKIKEKDCRFSFFYTGGPGGQHQNKNATGVRGEVSLKEILEENEIKKIIEKKEKYKQKFIGEKNDIRLRISSRKHKSQHRNKQEVLKKMNNFLEELLKEKKERKKTQVPLKAKEERKKFKKRRKEKKLNRKKIEF